MQQSMTGETAGHEKCVYCGQPAFFAVGYWTDITPMAAKVTKGWRTVHLCYDCNQKKQAVMRNLAEDEPDSRDA